MKKTFILLVTVIFSLTVFAQSERNTTLMKKKDAVAVKTTLTGFEPGEDVLTPIPFVKATNPYFAGATRYDLQSNNSCSNRIIVHEDGTKSMVWVTCSGSATDRGTGYNYYDPETGGFQNPGTSTSRIENVRTGWGTIGALEHEGGIGEIVAAHDGASSLVISTRRQKGTGDWSFSNLQGPAASNGTSTSTCLLWPSLITSGNIIHLIACTESDPGYLYEGINTCLVYYRGVYNAETNGVTWASPKVVGNATPSYIAVFSGDAYAIDARGDKVVILVCSPYTDAFYWESNDGGLTFGDRQIIFDSPVPDGYQESTTLVPDTPYVCDGGGSIAIGDDGIVHVALGITMILNENITDGTSSYFPGVDGMVYWNSSMGTIGQFGSGRNFDFDPEVLAANGYTVIRQIDSDCDDYADNDNVNVNNTTNYGCGAISMPQLIVDNGTVYWIYVGMLESPFMDATGNHYRGIFGLKSTNNGQTWNLDEISWLSYGNIFFDIDWNTYSYDNYLPIAASENVFPAVSRRIVNGKIDILWQHSETAGSEIKENSVAVATAAAQMNWFSIDASKIGTFNNYKEVCQNLWQDETQDGLVEIPVFNPNGGTHILEVDVTITTTTSGAQIYYTTDGSTPTTSSTLYSGPVHITQSCVLKAIAHKDGETSPVAQASYEITTGINVSSLTDLSIYPNPATNKLSIEFSSTESSQATLTIANLLGQVVYSETMELVNGFNKKELNVSSLNDGFYLVNIKSNQGTTTRKLIIQ